MTALRSSLATPVLMLPLVLSQEETTTTTTSEPSAPVQAVDAWVQQAHNDKLAMGLIAVLGIGLLGGLLLGKR